MQSKEKGGENSKPCFFVISKIRISQKRREKIRKKTK
jgi:DNA phosphorothioation-dependent restriction protein DptG